MRKKIYFFYIIVFFTSIFLFISCQYFSLLSKEEWSEFGKTGSGGDDDNTTDILYAIGDIGPSGVGIVFYITGGGLHGLEATPSDQSASQVWIEGGTTQTTLNGNTLTAIGTGLANSNYIIAQAGHTGSAALLCRNYNGGGLTDWFLPSIDELNVMYTQQAVIGAALDFYWSSSEYSSADRAWLRLFDGGSPNDGVKSGTWRVRAIRAF